MGRRRKKVHDEPISVTLNSRLGMVAPHLVKLKLGTHRLWWIGVGGLGVQIQYEVWPSPWPLIRYYYPFSPIETVLFFLPTMRTYWQQGQNIPSPQGQGLGRKKIGRGAELSSRLHPEERLFMNCCNIMSSRSNCVFSLLCLCNRRWDGGMASPIQQTWTWVNIGRWWGTGKPDMLQSMGSQGVWHDLATEEQQLLNG